MRARATAAIPARRSIRLHSATLWGRSSAYTASPLSTASASALLTLGATLLSEATGSFLMRLVARAGDHSGQRLVRDGRQRVNVGPLSLESCATVLFDGRVSMGQYLDQGSL